LFWMTGEHEKLQDCSTCRKDANKRIASAYSCLGDVKLLMPISYCYPIILSSPPIASSPGKRVNDDTIHEQHDDDEDEARQEDEGYYDYD
jgi:hypothetical protein